MRYFKSYVLLSLFLTENGLYGFSYKDLPKDCGTTRYKDVQIQSRPPTSALVGEFPWMVRVGKSERGTQFFYCSGSLIHPSYVITAAHCGTQSNIVRLGENNLNTNKDCSADVCAPPYQDIAIGDHIFSDHCRITNTNDMSLLSLSKPAKLNDFVRPICIPVKKLTLNLLKSQTAATVGWGVTYSGWGILDASKSKTNRDLEYIQSPILNREMCNKNYIRNLEENELCVGYPQDVEMPCVTDSGGPLMTSMQIGATNETRKYIIGVASHDLSLCRSGELRPVIYTDVSSHVDWILSKINHNMHSKSKSGK